MILKLGTISQEVAKWQKFLKLTPDGIFGANTESATKTWQSKNGLRADGIVGEDSFSLAAEQGYSIPATSYFPPRPAFGSPSAADRAKMFGNFRWQRKNATDIIILDNWAAQNITKVQIPQIIGIEGAPKDGYIYFHKAGISQLKAFFDEVEAKGLKNLIISWAGSFYPRFIRGSQNTLSNHSWGTAFDINAPQNWLGQRPAPEGSKGSLLRLVPIANKHGFYWGGHYSSRLDGMHFELAQLKSVSSLQPALATVGSSNFVVASAQGNANPFHNLSESEIISANNAAIEAATFQPAGNPTDGAGTQAVPAAIPEGQVATEVTKTEEIKTDSGKETVETKSEIQQQVVVETPEKKGFFKTVWTEVSALFVGNTALQGGADKLQQLQFLGLSSRFWTVLGFLAIGGSIAWLIYRYMDFRQTEQREIEMTKVLVDTNSTPNNIVSLMSPEQIEQNIAAMEKAGYVVVRRK